MHRESLQDAFASRDLERLVALMDEGVVWRGVPPPPHHHDEGAEEHDHGPGICRDRGEVQHLMRRFLARGGTTDPVVVAEQGDSVAVELRASPIGDDPDQRLLARYQVLTFRGDRIVLIQDYTDRDKALAALG